MPLHLLGLECSLDTAALNALEDVARSTTAGQVADWFAQFPATEEVALLSTCHRVELVLLTRTEQAVEDWRTVLPGAAQSWRLRSGDELVRHLFRVAAGLESLATGETEVSQQVRAAGRSIQSRYPRAVLRELFAAAADTAAAPAPPGIAPRSIASTAAARLMELVDCPMPNVLVVGSGTVGRQVVESLSATARLTLVYHQREPEEAFLRATGARALCLDRLSEGLATADAVVTAAKFGNRGLSAANLPRDRRLLLMDLGMPRNIDPNVRDLPNVRLVDLEQLHARARPRYGNEALDARLDDRAARVSDRLTRLLLEPWVDALRRAAEQVRLSELSTARPYLGRLDPDQEAAVDRLSRRLVARLLADPTERIRSLPPGPEGDRQRRLALELLRPCPGDS